MEHTVDLTLVMSNQEETREVQDCYDNTVHSYTVRDSRRPAQG